MAQEGKEEAELKLRTDFMEAIKPLFQCHTCKAFPDLNTVVNGKCFYRRVDQCSCCNQCMAYKCRNEHSLMVPKGKQNTGQWQLNLLATTAHPCKNIQYGCPEITVLDKLEAHEGLCAFAKQL